MLYRSRGSVLFVQQAPSLGLLVPLVIRDRRESRQAPKPERPARGLSVRRPRDLPEASDPRPYREPAPLPCADPADALMLTLGRWKRVCSWWLFTAAEIEAILS